MAQIQTPVQTPKEHPRLDRSRYWRLADLAQFPEENGFRYEIIDGVLVVTAAPARPHTVVAARLIEDANSVLKRYYPSWSLMPQPINLEVETPEKTHHCEPDLSIFDQPFEAVLENEDLLPVIVIEIVSPGNPDNDYVRKIQAYAAIGIPEYWIVDPRHRIVTLLQLVGTGEQRRYEQIRRSRLLPELDLDPEALFAGIK